MTFLNGIFYIFLLGVLAIYYMIPTKYRYIVLFVSSLAFYGWYNINMLFTLLLIIAITYLGGFFIYIYKKRAIYLAFFLGTLSILCIYKYSSLVMVIGLSFYIFQATSYLGDVYRGKILPEFNPVKYGAFVAFFPTLLCGPIQKSRDLLPQISSPKEFDQENAIKGVLLMIWGLLEKLLVANRLHVITQNIYVNYEVSNSVQLIFAAVCYSLYIYADFSAYSDIARGVAKLLGIEIGKNFNNPYCSTTCSEFWRRWHITLNDWFMENVYFPLGGSKKGTIRKYLNIMIVFLISGMWHGNTYNFIAWGLINGLFVVISTITLPVRNHFLASHNINIHSKAITYFRRFNTFVLITISWIFFANGTRPSLVILNRIAHINVNSIMNPHIMNVTGSFFDMTITLIWAVIFIIVQIVRIKEAQSYTSFMNIPSFIRYIICGFALNALFISACTYYSQLQANTAGSQFIYFNF